MQQLRSRRRNPEIWHKANRLVAGLIFFGLAAFLFVAFHPEWVRFRGLETRFEEKQATLDAMKLENERLKREENLLKNDPEYVEILARDALGVMKAGEEIIRIDTGDSPAPGLIQKPPPAIP